jgi:hypothetical protein
VADDRCPPEMTMRTRLHQVGSGLPEPDDFLAVYAYAAEFGGAQGLRRMKLLFDESLSPRLVALLSDLFAGSESALRNGLARAGDRRILHTPARSHRPRAFVCISRRRTSFM